MVPFGLTKRSPTVRGEFFGFELVKLIAAETSTRSLILCEPFNKNE